MRLLFETLGTLSAAIAGWLRHRQDCYYLLVCSKQHLSSCLIHNKWMGENGLKFTPPERSIVLVMHERMVREIRVNENTALNLEDVIENVIALKLW